MQPQYKMCTNLAEENGNFVTSVRVLTYMYALPAGFPFLIELARIIVYTTWLLASFFMLHSPSRHLHNSTPFHMVCTVP